MGGVESVTGGTWMRIRTGQRGPDGGVTETGQGGAGRTFHRELGRLELAGGSPWRAEYQGLVHERAVEQARGP